MEIRFAERQDVPFILQMIEELAAYEHAADQVHATAELLEQWLFDSPVAYCLIGLLDGQPSGIALYFLNFSTWDAKPGIYLEDLIVSEQARGNGLGLALLRKLASLALERGYTRLEWARLDWNTPSLEFYSSIGALARKDWILHRLDTDAMRELL
jgi:GNAT superfamily N-acetyltransferase